MYLRRLETSKSTNTEDPGGVTLGDTAVIYKVRWVTPHQQHRVLSGRKTQSGMEELWHLCLVSHLTDLDQETILPAVL